MSEMFARTSIAPRWLLLGVISALTLLSAGSASADVFIWNGASGGDYDDLANWLVVDGQGAAVAATVLPGAADTVGFNSTVTGPVDVQSFSELTGLQVLSGNPEIHLDSANLVISSRLLLLPGTDSDTPDLTVTGNGSLVTTSTTPGAGIVLSNGAALTFQGAGLTVDSGAAAVGVSTPPDVDGFPGNNGSADQLIVDGANWTTRKRLDIGGSADGEITVRNGGTIDDLHLSSSVGTYLGSAAGVTGTLAVESGGSFSSSKVIVGGIGTGEVTVEGGGALETDTLLVGAADELGGSGNLTLRGAGSTLDVADRLTIGDGAGSGNVVIEDGTATVNRLIASSGANSSLTFDGGQLNITKQLTVSNGSAFSVGNGTGTTAELVLDSKTNLSSGVSQLPNFSFADGLAIESDGIVRLDGSHPNGARGLLYASELIDNGGQFDWIGGTLHVGNDVFTVGQGTLLGSAITLDGFTTDGLRVDGELVIDNGSLTMISGFAGLKAERISTANGGTLDFQLGSIWLTGTEPGDGLTVGSGGLLGSNVTLSHLRSLRIDTTTTVNSGSLLTVNGGRLHTAVLDLGGDLSRLNWTSGLIDISDLAIGTGGTLGANLSLGTGQILTSDQLDVTDGLLSIAGGELQLNSHTIGTGTGGELRFISGELDANVAVQVGGTGGITGTGGGSTVTLATGDDWDARPHAVTVDTATLEIAGGKLSASRVDLTTGGNLHFDGGELELSATSELIVGSGGMLGAAGSSTVVVAGGDTVNVRRSSSQTDRLHITDATVALSGGTLKAQKLLIDTGSGGALHYGGGVLAAYADSIQIGGTGGILGFAGSTTVTVGTLSSLTTDDQGGFGADLTVAAGHTLELSGGSITTGILAVDPGGVFDFSEGLLTLEDDLFIGSSYAGSSTGTVLASNTAPAASYFYEMNDGMNIVVKDFAETHVDSSGLLIRDGASLTTWDMSLDSKSNVTVEQGGGLTVNHIEVSGDTNIAGTVVAEQVDVGAKLTLTDTQALIIGKIIVNAGGTLGGVGTIEGGVTNGDTTGPGLSPGTLSIDGFYEQLDSGTLVIELGKEAAPSETLLHDVLAVSGVVDLDGELDVQVDLGAGFDPNFDPVAEDVGFIFLTGELIVGAFDDLVERDLGDGYSWVLTYTNTDVSLSITDNFLGDIDLRTLAQVPEPSTGVLFALGLVAMGARRRRARK